MPDKKNTMPDKIFLDPAGIHSHASKIHAHGQNVILGAQQAIENNTFRSDKAGNHHDWQNAVNRLYDNLNAIAIKVKNHGSYTISQAQKIHNSVDALCDYDSDCKISVSSLHSKENPYLPNTPPVEQSK